MIGSVDVDQRKVLVNFQDLILSPDGGATWQRLSAEAARSIAFDPADPQRIFVATDRGILRSDDGGIHFRGANQGLGKP